MLSLWGQERDGSECCMWAMQNHDIRLKRSDASLFPSCEEANKLSRKVKDYKATQLQIQNSQPSSLATTKAESDSKMKGNNF